MTETQTRDAPMTGGEPISLSPEEVDRCLAGLVRLREGVRDLYRRFEAIMPKRYWLAPLAERKRWVAPTFGFDKATDGLFALEDHLCSFRGDVPAPSQEGQKATDAEASRVESNGEAESPLADLPSYESLTECAVITRAVRDSLSWLDDDASDCKPHSFPSLRSFLRLMHYFGQDFRIRKSRQDLDEPEHRLILEDGGAKDVLPWKPDNAIHAMVKYGGLLTFDDAGVAHLTDKAVELCKAERR